MTHRNFPVLTLSGSPVDIGTQHGSTMSKQIVELANMRKSILIESGIDVETIRAVAEKSWHTICKELPHLGEELSATAYASKISDWELIVAGAFTDISDLLLTDFECCSECTVGITPRCILGTWDSHYGAERGGLILSRRQNEGVSTLSFTTAGWPVQFGINSYGLGFATTNLTPAKSRVGGLPYIAALAKISTMADVKSALVWMKTQNFMSGHSYILVDAKDAVIVETTPEEIYKIAVIDFYCQTNHYCSDIDDNSCFRYLSGSTNRAKISNEARHAFDNQLSFMSWLINNPEVLRRPNETSNILSCAAYHVDVAEMKLGVADISSNPNNMSYYTF